MKEYWPIRESLIARLDTWIRDTDRVTKDDLRAAALEMQQACDLLERTFVAQRAPRPFFDYIAEGRNLVLGIQAFEKAWDK